MSLLRPRAGLVCAHHGRCDCLSSVAGVALQDDELWLADVLNEPTAPLPHAVTGAYSVQASLQSRDEDEYGGTYAHDATGNYGGGHRDRGESSVCQPTNDGARAAHELLASLHGIAALDRGGGGVGGRSCIARNRASSHAESPRCRARLRIKSVCVRSLAHGRCGLQPPAPMVLICG
jgi:hypothetical protein